MLNESRLRKLAGLPIKIEEDRDPTLTYTDKQIAGKIEKVTVSLEGKKSEKMTKLAQRWKEIKKETEVLKTKEEVLKGETKAAVSEYFDAKDIVYTRCVETISLTATISKQGEDKSNPDNDKVVTELLKLMPELEDKIKKLQEQFVTISKGKAPSLSVKVDESVVDWVKKFAVKAKALLTSFTSWGKSYDKKLAKIKDKMSLAEAFKLQINEAHGIGSNVIGRIFHSEKFNYRNKCFTAEASTLGGGFLKQLWNDSADVGFGIKSVKTGKIILFTLEDEVKDGEGDIQYWKFVVYNKERNPDLDGLTVEIFND